MAALAFSLAFPAPRSAHASNDTRTLTLHHIHTREDITITFKRNGQYDEAALKKLNHFVRDWRKDEEVQMDPKLYDMMWEVVQEIGYKGAIHIVCGYRSPATNAMLRSRSNGVARTSLHMQGKAMDFSLPGADVAAVRAAALRVQGGGVGYYPSSGIAFVHMDVGSVRHWPRMTREQLAKVFPDGRTLHIPTDGNPMPGYALALADHERTGGDRLINRAKPSNLIAALFGRTQPDNEEIADQTSLTPQPAATPARRVAALAPATQNVAQVPLPQRRPVFQVAASDTKPAPAPTTPMFQIASSETRPAPMPAGSFNVASLSPNQIIGYRGYWQGPQETTAQNTAPQNDTQVSYRSIEPEPQVSYRSIEPEITASSRTTNDRVPPDVALSYATRGDATSDTLASRLAAAPAIVTRGVTASVAMKPTEPPTARTAANDRLDDPWLRGVVLAPRVERAMTITTFGAADFSKLAPFMQKPASSIVMTFSADPHLGMSADHFAGSAVVFQATVTFGMRTAAVKN